MPNGAKVMLDPRAWRAMQSAKRFAVERVGCVAFIRSIQGKEGTALAHVKHSWSQPSSSGSSDQSFQNEPSDTKKLA